MILNSPWIAVTPASKIIAALAAHGEEAYYVGGCVRDSLMGKTPKDIDIATSALPDVVADLFRARGLQVIPTGIKHGTVTVVDQRQTFEITTFRKDVSTDGRNATVAYTRDAMEDAARRDFTVNALYMTKEGVVMDSTGTGIEDVMHRRIRFVGDADTRCREDYLRVLRYFRFYAKFGGGECDPEALEAVKTNWPKMFPFVSNERIMMEIRNILTLDDPIPALALMDELGMLHRLLGTRAYQNPYKLYALLRAERAVGEAPDWHRRYAYLANGMMPVFPISNREENRLRRATKEAAAGEAPAIVAFQYKEPEVAVDAHLLSRAADFKKPLTRSTLDAEIARGMAATLPVDGPSFYPHGLVPGKELGSALHFAKEAFKLSDLQATRDELITCAMRRMQSV